ncbi:unnamed protein product [Ceratitis capitata]|uniref:Wiskott-Aldrich syndrome protein family member n=1 Tax=Ceratitis capitata TaxID=7213 RepID=A0A811UDI1_CERCA|nr:unnamed protein product [Ceratitis capitata]
MPIPKRSIEPVHVSRSFYQHNDLQLIELETVTNTALTNIIRQLSSLSKHAEDIFGELAHDVGNISNRANSLQARIDHLSIKVTQLDSTMEDVPLTDITRKKGFRSTKIFDQKIFSHSTMPTPMLETYTMCDKPPPLNKLNSYRDDGKDGLKFYTDPNYFFELWRQEMLKDTERVMHDKGKKLNRPRQQDDKRVRKPHNTREKQRLIAIGHGETIMPNNITYQTPNSIINMEASYGNDGIYESRQHRPNSIDLRNICNTDQAGGGFYSTVSQAAPAISSAVVSDAIGINSSVLGKHENGTLPIHSMDNTDQAMQMQHFFDEEMLNESQPYCDPGSLSSEGMCAPGANSRMKIRPSQPPPAPPSNGSKNCTPVSSNANTPTRNRNLLNNRDILPPPPPIPEGVMNTTSTPRALSVINGNSTIGGPIQLPNNSTIRDKSNIMLHLDNKFANMNMIMTSQQLNYNDSASAGKLEHQHTKKTSTIAAPPPPPPPPPLLQTEFTQQCSVGGLNAVINGDVHKRIIDETIGAKKHLPPFYDSRTDLMKAIRDGNNYLELLLLGNFFYLFILF